MTRRDNCTECNEYVGDDDPTCATCTRSTCYNCIPDNNPTLAIQKEFIVWCRSVSDMDDDDLWINPYAPCINLEEANNEYDDSEIDRIYNNLPKETRDIHKGFITRIQKYNRGLCADGRLGQICFQESWSDLGEGWYVCNQCCKIRMLKDKVNKAKGQLRNLGVVDVSDDESDSE